MTATSLRDALASLEGRRLTGVVPLGPKTMAIAFDGKPRAFLWIRLEPKRASLALDERLPISPDPRGTPFGGLERPLRGLEVRSLDGAEGPEGFLTFSLSDPALAESEGTPAAETHRLSLSAEGPRISFALRIAEGDRVLWALDRKEEAAADAEGAGAEPAGPPPAVPAPLAAPAAQSAPVAPPP
ncbi:MAG TPA: hypothetical protein VLT84_03140, partial [Acidobacteriota bacterium]|nr:hypothetical protein [Acidobacteriota bacterium]